MQVLKEGERAVFFLDADGAGQVPHGRGRGILKLDDADNVKGANVTLQQVKDAVRDANGNGKGGR
jgi:hypothetical protein